MSVAKQALIDAVVRAAGDGEQLPARLRRIARWGKYLAPTPGHRRQLTMLEQAADRKSPAIQLIARIFSDTSPACRRALVSLFVDHTWEGYRQRRRFQKEHGLFPPSFIVISPLARCNLKCVGCYAGAYGAQEPVLSYDDIERILKEVRGWGSRFVVISGGEPLLLWRRMPGSDRGLRDIAAQYRDTLFLMYTNGTLITDELARELAELGNVTPAISIEGYREETDARRGAGVFDQVVGAMQRLREHGALYGASVTYTSQNYQTVASDQFLDMLLELGCYYAWYFMYVPVGREPALELMVTPEQRRLVARKTWEWFTTRPIFVADFWNSGPLVGGCIAAGRPNGYLHITHQGDICPCVFMMYSDQNIHTTDSPTPLTDALHSEFFTRLRAGQRTKQHNPLAPCMIVDHPEVLKEAVETTGAHPTQDGQTVLTTLHEELVRRARQWQQIADEMWVTSPDYQAVAEMYRDADWRRAAEGEQVTEPAEQVKVAG